MEIYSVNVVEKNPVPKSQTKPFYIETKEAPSVFEIVGVGNAVVSLKSSFSWVRGMLFVLFLAVTGHVLVHCRRAYVDKHNSFEPFTV